jgi:hypothetical protein
MALATSSTEPLQALPATHVPVTGARRAGHASAVGTVGRPFPLASRWSSLEAEATSREGARP